ncbi:MAG: hypothetical protein H8E63_05640 [Proteobacteria bacterium]|jgi:hypothetical protein|nr:hypothetical protein [Pseudomonadota bacterium]
MAEASCAEIPEGCQALSLDLFDDLPESVTLLELVYAISAISNDEDIVVDTVVAVLALGRVQLRGNFRGTPTSEMIP